jgi:predicted nucleic acid-binding protein
VKPVVVDASVAAKWFPPLDREPLSRQARILLERWQRGEIKLMAPDFICVEMANIFWKAVRLNRCSLQVAESALALFRSQNFFTMAAPTLIDRAIHIAIAHGRTAYDSLYVALAVESNAEMVTADQKLANALSAHFPVTLLGAM